MRDHSPPVHGIIEYRQWTGGGQRAQRVGTRNDDEQVYTGDRAELDNGPPVIVVVNSTPLIYLAAIGRFDLLRSLYSQIIIPAAVYQEVVIQGSGQWGAAETAAADWIECRAVADRSAVHSLLSQLDLGEKIGRASW